MPVFHINIHHISYNVNKFIYSIFFVLNIIYIYVKIYHSGTLCDSDNASGAAGAIRGPRHLDVFFLWNFRLSIYSTKIFSSYSTRDIWISGMLRFPFIVCVFFYCCCYANEKWLFWYCWHIFNEVCKQKKPFIWYLDVDIEKIKTACERAQNMCRHIWMCKSH